MEPIELGTRRELFVDDYLIETMRGVQLCLHAPVAQEVALTFDAPWEGNTSGYVTIFRDGTICRMYYRGSGFDPETKKYSKERTCYAESRDGITWTKPDLAVVEFDGSWKNNIILEGEGCHNFTPFRDTRPGCADEDRYKALARGRGGLIAFRSSDAIHWTLIQEEAVITEGAFDSQNLAFWDAVRDRYVDFHRGFREGFRDIMTATSTDFLNWTDPVWLDYADAPREHLYTNAVIPCPGAPHVFLGFPKRFLPDRKAPYDDSEGVSDGLFMTSRDGVHWHRWGEAFLRPGPQRQRWVNRNNMIAWGLLETESTLVSAPPEWSLYSGEGYYQRDCRLRRHTIRKHGFVSVHASADVWEIVTKPVTFAGGELRLNYATSAAGSIRVEIQDEDGRPIEGYSATDCVELYGDELDGAVAWSKGADLDALAGRPIRLRFILRDADLYALQFAADAE